MLNDEHSGETKGNLTDFKVEEHGSVDVMVKSNKNKKEIIK